MLRSGSGCSPQVFHRVVPQKFLCGLGCVFRVFVLLADEPSAQSELLRRSDDALLVVSST